MDLAIRAMLAGFVFGFLACALVLRLQYKRKLREARKLRDEVRNTMRSTIYPSSAGWWELHKKLEAMPQREATRQELASAYGKGQQNANENPRGTAQRSDTDAST